MKINVLGCAMGWVARQYAAIVVLTVLVSLVMDDFKVNASGDRDIRLLNKTRGYRIHHALLDVNICGYRDVAVNSSQQQEIECEPDKRFCFAAAAVDQVGNSYRISAINQGCWPDKPMSACDEGVCIIRTPIPTSGDRILPEFCCCKGLYCNLNLTYVPRAIPMHNNTSSGIIGNRGIEGSKTSDTIVLGVVSSVFAMALLIGIILVSWRCVSQRKALQLHVHEKGIENGDEVFQGLVLDLNNITFADFIHQGHYSTVRKAFYDGRDVVVKSYPPHSHNHWQNERNIYYMVGTHPSVAKFLASFEVHTEIGPEGVLVMDYYPNGSLLSYLKQNTLTWPQMCQLALTVANGLAYLHGEVDEYSVDQTKRPVIVHRDLNSRNVLVKLDGTCVLADFGFAVRLMGKQGEPFPDVGTVRYMPPEMLGGAVNWHDESALKQADVYSLGLVIWEIARRCKEPYGDEPVPEAKLPYEEELSNHPTTDMIHQLVVHGLNRPAFPEKWKTSHFVYQLLKDTIEECWDQEPEARLTALCVVRRMQEVIQMRQLGQFKDTGTSLPNRGTFSGHVPKDFILKNIVSSNIGKQTSYQPLRSGSITNAFDTVPSDKTARSKTLQCTREPCAHDCCCIPARSNQSAWPKEVELRKAKGYRSEIIQPSRSDAELSNEHQLCVTACPLSSETVTMSSSLPHDLHKFSRHGLEECAMSSQA